MVDAITIPKRGRGRPTPKKMGRYKAELQRFAERILEIRSTLDFAPSSRGWCYMLEELAGLTKDRFDEAEGVIRECRKRGLLPLDITAKDEARAFVNDEVIFEETPEEYVENLLWWAHSQVEDYYHQSFWEGQPYYVQMVVEKIDLKELFGPVCKPFFVRLANTRGWSDLHMRADMMRKSEYWEDRGNVPVLLYCGDFDPAGVLISDVLLNNLKELEDTVGWDPSGLVIDRFGLNLDFIEANRLSWINNLMTSSGKDLADPGHGDHQKEHVQKWLAEIGPRKVEANALVTRPDAGRQLCYDAITQYVDLDAPQHYLEEMQDNQDEARAILERMVPEGRGPMTNSPQPGDRCPRCEGRLQVVSTQVIGDSRVRYLGCRRYGYRPENNNSAGNRTAPGTACSSRLPPSVKIRNHCLTTGKQVIECDR